MKLNIRFSGLKKFAAASVAAATILLGACDGTQLTGGKNNIIETATEAGTFQTLLAAVDAAGLTGALSNVEQPYTLFAPTDDAFAALGQPAIDALLANPAELTNVLQYHLISGPVNSEAVVATIADTGIVTMLNGQEAMVAQSGENLQIGNDTNGYATITAADIQTSNGVIHVIDAVLTPTAPAPVDPVEPDPNATTDNLSQIISDDGNFSELTNLLTSSQLTNVLADDTKNFTVFAPTDAAFAALPQATIDELTADPDKLQAVLLYHVVPDAIITAADAVAADGTSLTTAQGGTLAVSAANGTVQINNATVTRTDLTAANGIVHEIDTVLIPPATNNDSIFAVLNNDPNYTTLVGFLQTTGLDSDLSNMDANVTIFAPNNAAMADSDTALQAGYTSDIAALTQLLNGHVAAGSLTSADVIALDGQTLQMSDGSTKTIELVGADVSIDGAKVIQADIQAGNGVIHGIDKVLIGTYP